MCGFFFYNDSLLTHLHIPTFLAWNICDRIHVECSMRDVIKRDLFLMPVLQRAVYTIIMTQICANRLDWTKGFSVTAGNGGIYYNNQVISTESACHENELSLSLKRSYPEHLLIWEQILQLSQEIHSTVVALCNCWLTKGFLQPVSISSLHTSVSAIVCLLIRPLFSSCCKAFAGFSDCNLTHYHPPLMSYHLPLDFFCGKAWKSQSKPKYFSRYGPGPWFSNLLRNLLMCLASSVGTESD